jgi:glycosyltransferase involved in cell wall biosynthesis
MRILLPLAQADPGGIMTVARGLARHLPQALAPHDELTVLGDPDRPGVTRLDRLIEGQWRAARAARDFDLVHLADYRPLLLSRAPFTVTIHDLTFLDRPDWYPPAIGAYKRAMLRATLAKRPAAVVCVSDDTRERFLRRAPAYPRERVRTIHPGLEPPPVASRPDTPADSYFLTVGGIEPRRNHLTLLAAFERARAAGLGLRWVVVGRPHYRGGPILERLNTARGVEVRGWVDDAELDSLYRNARFVALPSRHEGFGYTPLEAMARGVPTAVATGSALDETAADAALRIDPHDVDGWADALGRLDADSSLRAQLIRRGQENTARFRWAATAQAHADLFREIAGE